jgi:hypothetical protein
MTPEEFVNELVNNLDLPFSINEVEKVESNAGTVWITLKDESVYWLSVQECDPEEDAMDRHLGKFDVSQVDELPGGKLFFWRDKSGGGGAGVFTDEDLKEWDTDEMDWGGVSLRDYLDEAEVGDKWENAANKITRTK